MPELDRETRERLLDELARAIAAGGASRFLVAPAEPCERAFPEPWRPTRAGVRALLRRLAWHAGLDADAPPAERGPEARSISVDDRRHGAPPTQRRPETSLELLSLTRGDALFALYFIGEDDVPGTFAHELGVWFAALHPAPRTDAAPYREPAEAACAADELAVDPEQDLERGSRACVYLGLGVLAANAAYQQYSRAGRFNGGYSPLEYDIVQGGYVPMTELAFLLAVQATVRAEPTATPEPPAGLGRPQRDEVDAFLADLRGQRASLRTRLGIPADLAATPRPDATAFDVDLFADEAFRKDAFRLRVHRGGVGAVAGGVLGAGVALLVASRGLAPVTLVGAGVGHVLGRRVRTSRCTACASIAPLDAPSCMHCGARLHGTIESAAERLDK